MTKNVLFFGTGKMSEVISYYAETECGLTIAAYVVDEGFEGSGTFLGKPVINSSSVHALYPPEQYDAFVAIGYHDLNRLRAQKCEQMETLGYTLISVVSPKTNLPQNVTFGKNCFIMPPAILHPCVTLGQNVFVWSGALIGHHSTIEDHAWLTSGCSVGGNVTIGAHSFLAINATVGHSVSIGEKCFLGANTLVVKDLEPNKVVVAEAHKPIRLTSDQFLRMSSFANL